MLMSIPSFFMNSYLFVCPLKEHKISFVVSRTVIESSQVDTEPSSSSTQLKNSKLEFDSNSIEIFFICSKLDSKNSKGT